MKYKVEIEINKPVDEVIKLFDNVDNLYEWMDGLQSFETISGTQGEVGAKAKLVYKMGKREIEMIETITSKNLPDDFSGTYETKGVFNKIKNSFVKVDENTTKYVSEQEFIFESFAMKFMALIMPGAFKKQSMKYLTAFKKFAENN